MSIVLVHSFFETEGRYSGNDQTSLITSVEVFVCVCSWLFLITVL